MSSKTLDKNNPYIVTVISGLLIALISAGFGFMFNDWARAVAKEEKITEWNQQIQKVESIVDRYERISGWGNSQSQAKNDGGGKTRNELISCEKGQYVTSIRLLDSNGGDPCHNCLTGIEIECHDLPK